MRSESPAWPEPGPAPSAAAMSPTARLIARATAGPVEYEDDGRMSVLFPPPGAVFASPGAGTLAREESPPADAPAPAAMPADVPPSAAAAPGAAAPLDRDELYADFMRRMRRDILDQREQLGEL